MIGCLHPVFPASKIAGCRGIIPLLGEFEGASPLKVLRFQGFIPLLGAHKGAQEIPLRQPLPERRPTQGCLSLYHISLSFLGDKVFLRTSACFPLLRLAGEGAPAGAGEGVVLYFDTANPSIRRFAPHICYPCLRSIQGMIPLHPAI
jgi:hypothetical protein